MDHTSNKNFKVIREGFAEWDGRINELRERCDRMEKSMQIMLADIQNTKQVMALMTHQRGNIGSTVDH